MKINRKLTAISRRAFSRPVATAIAHGVITHGTTVFDYGCGRGQDVARLRVEGYVAAGYDPNWCPECPKRHASVVMLSYVLNVIEDGAERVQVLADAWRLTGQVLVVSVRTSKESVKGIAYKDGILTSKNTFQKLYHQKAAEQWIEMCLGVPAIPAGEGIFYCYKA